MPRLAIFDSSVWRGMPSFAAAPDGPETRPLLAFSAFSMIVRSCSESRRPRLRVGEFCDRGVVSGRLTQPAFVHRKCVAVAKQNGALDDVLQFAYVAGPIVHGEQVQRSLLNVANPLPGALSVAIDQILHKQRNVVSCVHAATESGLGKRLGDRTNPIGNVPAATSAFRFRLVAARIRTSIATGWLLPNRSNSRSCKTRSRRDLRLRRQFADLIQENRAAVGRLEPPEPSLKRASKRTFLVAKQFRRDK